MDVRSQKHRLVCQRHAGMSMFDSKTIVILDISFRLAIPVTLFIHHIFLVRNRELFRVRIWFKNRAHITILLGENPLLGAGLAC